MGEMKMVEGIIPGKNMKQWTNIKGENSWTMFKVIAEFVDGFEKLNKIGPCISIFGSARTSSDEKYYKLATEIARKFADEGYGVITGGGPGIMEAANKGAHEQGGASVGLNINLPFEQFHNAYIDYDKNLEHRYFFVRKVMLVKYAQAFVVMPGGYGTMDELFEVLTLIQTNMITKVPVILFGTEYWSGLKDWIIKVMFEKAHNINQQDLDLMPITDDPDEVIRIVANHFKVDGNNRLSPNLEL